MLKLKFKIVLILMTACVVVLLLVNLLLLKFFLWDMDVLGQDINSDLEKPIYCGVTDYTLAIRYDTLAEYGVQLNQTGERLFKTNCAPCHAVHEVVVGPALGRISERRNKEWIYNFVQSPEEMINSGDSVAVNLFREFNYFKMPSFEKLNSAEVDSIIDYIDQYFILYPRTVIAY